MPTPTPPPALLDLLARSPAVMRYMASYYRAGDETQRTGAVKRACLHMLTNEAHSLETEERAVILHYLSELEAANADRG